MSEVFERVRRVVAENQQIEPQKITIDSTFEELGIDSFDGVNLLFGIESEFDIQVSDEDAKKLRGIRDVVEGVERLTADRAVTSGD
jgi:acyl carrier protein